MLSGRRQAVDGFFIKANVSMDSLIEKEILDDAETFRQELTVNEDEEQPVALRVEANDYQEVKQNCSRRISWMLSLVIRWIQ